MIVKQMIVNEFGYSLSVHMLNEVDGGGWLIEIPELPGCITDGDTLEEALSRVDDVINGWIFTAKELGRDIPKPKMYDFST